MVRLEPGLTETAFANRDLADAVARTRQCSSLRRRPIVNQSIMWLQSIEAYASCRPAKR
ncbi:hypothetical protein MES4922_380002 [Mesorhizobium ventifaucium]|uniref:Uncharacterized protein n=1 Tax=Mesorhizobium ventifaucium TaxID=666020 RepID=A0ABM9E6W0_9HYPH|nr:hypothetical protein MES4922_380002 [Mesorhizobium ventifaucium]